MSLDVLDEDAELVRAPWSPRPWWAWTLALLALGAMLILLAGLQLADARFGTQLRSRGCDTSALGGLALLGAGALLTALGCIFTRLRRPVAVIELDAASLLVTLPVPIALLAATLPGLLGCSIRSDIASVGLVGEALVGMSGALLAAVAVTLIASAVAMVVQVVIVAGDLGVSDEAPDLVELAMAEAEALEEAGASEVFRGVDSSTD